MIGRSRERPTVEVIVQPDCGICKSEVRRYEGTVFCGDSVHAFVPERHFIQNRQVCMNVEYY